MTFTLSQPLTFQTPSELHHTIKDLEELCPCCRCWKKFRSQTSNNMDRWNSRGVKSQGKEEKKREDRRGERGRRKKMRAREKEEKVAVQRFFPMICCSGGRKVGSLKQQVQSQLVKR